MTNLSRQAGLQRILLCGTSCNNETTLEFEPRLAWSGASHHALLCAALLLGSPNSPVGKVRFLLEGQTSLCPSPGAFCVRFE
jgi:hypothetical protein